MLPFIQALNLPNSKIKNRKITSYSKAHSERK